MTYRFMKKLYLQPKIEESILILHTGVMSGGDGEPPKETGASGPGFVSGRKLYV